MLMRHAADGVGDGTSGRIPSAMRQALLRLEARKRWLRQVDPVAALSPCYPASCLPPTTSCLPPPAMRLCLSRGGYGTAEAE
jgi:hypothetical protein